MDTYKLLSALLSKGRWDWTPLHAASQNGHFNVIRYFLETHQAANTPLHIAALNGHLQVVKYFIEDWNCNPNVKGQWDWICLHADNGHLDVIKYLVDSQNCDPMIRDEDNNTPLHTAAS